MKKAQALSCIAILAASYPRQELNPDTLNAYATMLQDLEFEAVDAAVKRIICSSKWFPTIAEIRAEVAEGECGDLAPAELAWGEVQRAIGRWGMYNTPQWSTPELAAAVDAIGWRTICTDTNVVSTRARFIDAYRVTRERRVQGYQLGAHAPKALPSRTGQQLMLGELRMLTGGQDGEKG